MLTVPRFVVKVVCIVLFAVYIMYSLFTMNPIYNMLNAPGFVDKVD